MGFSVVTVLLAASCLAQAPRFVEAPPRAVPVIDHVDVVVVGGSEGGMAAAWRAAKLGAKVLLLNEYTFLGGETVIKDAFEPGAAPASAFGRALLGGLTASNHVARFPVVAAGLLKEAGVAFLYNTRHGGILTDGEGRLCGVVTANKAGLQAVVAKVVIDATCAGAVADAAGASRPPWTAETLAVSRPVPSADGKRREEVKRDAPMPAFTWALLNRAEDALREEKHRYVSGPFAHAMDFVMPNPLQCEATLADASLPAPDALDLGVCKPAGTERLFVIGSSCAVSRKAARELLRPATLADVGERLGERAAQTARSVTLPADDAISVKTAGAQQGVLPGLAVKELAGRERPYRLGARAEVRQGRDALPVWGEYDVIVVGGGPAGQGAAIAAGRAGMKVLMVEQNGFIGGSVALGIKGFWRGYRHGFNQEWRGKGSPVYQRLLREAKVDIWYHSLAMGAVLRGNAVEGVEVATWLGRGVALGKVVIDASGEGDVCAAAGAESFYLNDGDLCIEEASFIGQELYANSLPADPMDVAGFTAHHVLAGLFAGKQHFPMVQLRETRRIRGDVVIDELDVNAGRTWHDVIAVSASAFDPHGYYSSDYSFAGLMPMTKHVRDRDLTVYVPLRAILPKGLENIMAVGRNYSTTHDVQAIVRMNPDVLNLGYAAGYAAALCVKHGTTPRRVDVKALQRHLAEIGNLPAERLEALARDLPPPDAQALVQAAADPSQRSNLLTLARGGKASLQPLREAFAAAPTVAQAKALCLLGDASGVERLAAWIAENPLEKGNPYAWDGFLEVPELDGAMWVVAIPRDRRATAALVEKLRLCDAASGFNQARAVTMALGRIGDPQAAAALAEFLGKPGVQGHRDTGTRLDSLTSAVFSKAMVELFAASALVRCGDKDGLGRGILTGYLDDWRGIFVRYAGHILSGEPDVVP
jgi:NADPH-dependent 2,4-dienoyl-CoA reductase/sulfur reductase-like enzyme